MPTSSNVSRVNFIKKNMSRCQLITINALVNQILWKKLKWFVKDGVKKFIIKYCVYLISTLINDNNTNTKVYKKIKN